MMIDTAIQDDARDGMALIRACLNDDADAAQIIYDNCDLAGVLGIVTGVAAQGLIALYGEDGARGWVDRMQRHAADES
jgi:hypothetical protein